MSHILGWPPSESALKMNYCVILTHWPGRVWNCCGIPGIQCRLRNVCLKNQVSAVEMGFVISFKSELFFN